ncbi:MAG: phosphatidylinositol-3-phosphatase, partial [Solirubrobacteraceae bacterium]|nr:phosphatidylinositol-3-phosphatase [Solirubrobacteraceae bacterium]
TPMPGIGGPGGGRTGAVVLSRYVKPGSVSDTPYNHYSLLKSLEQVFGIGEYLGYANMAGLAAFGDDVYNLPDGGVVPTPGPLKPGDAGSTGTVQKVTVHVRVRRPARLTVLRARLQRQAGLAVRVTLQGTERALDPVRLRLVSAPGHGKRSRTVARTRARTLAHGTGTLRLRLGKAMAAKLQPGRYVLVAEAIHERLVVARARVVLQIRAR